MKDVTANRGQTEGSRHLGIALHARGRVDGVSEEAVARQSQPHDAGDDRAAVDTWDRAWTADGASGTVVLL